MNQDVRNKALMQNQLLNPRPETRGCTRWWWFGCAVEEKEILRELDEMKASGIGGVELQILYPVEPDQPEKGVKNQNYLSPEYFHYIRFAAEAAKERGMRFDLTLGSSWPFGGPFVPVELSAPNVIPYTLDVQGPCRFHYDFTTRLYGECVACVMGRMEGVEMIPESIVDITDKVVDKYLFNWEWGKELEEIDVPEGLHKIVLFISNEKRQTVLKPLPGGDGLIIDHNRKDALRMFLENGGDPIAERLGPELVQSYFCDSIEVFGQNWTDILYDEFRKRRGYELRPYVYALWGEVRGITDRVRYDFQRTLGELTVENFFEELTKWCHEKGCSSRIQAHGTWGDVLLAYGAADIPEGETFSAFDRYEVNTIHRKLASSAGHLYHKPIISNESFTWLRFPRFIVTPENVKAAADSIFLDGMNQLINHGYAYSPENSGKLGWPFYASTQLNHKNTWWPFYKHLGTYFNRVCDFLQRGKTRIKLAVYLPQADIWAENPLSDIHMCMKLEERLTTPLVDGIHKAGFWFDFVNDDVLSRWNAYDYDALLLLECDRMPVETARNIRAYAEAGHGLICKGQPPRRSCGLLQYEENSAEVDSVFRKLCSDGLCTVTENTLEGVLSALSEQIEPDVKVERNPQQIGFVHQTDGDTDIYFLANVSAEQRTERIVFCKQTRGFSVFDPMTAEEKKLLSVCEEDGTIAVELHFEPFQSLLFVFSPDMEKTYAFESGYAENLASLSGNWTLSVAETGFEKTYDALTGWEQEPTLRYFSGEGCYRTTFSLSEAQWEKVQQAQSVWLEFEHLGVAAQTFLNGTFVGDVFMRPYRIDVRKALSVGENKLEIRVRNLLINHAINPEIEEKDVPNVIDEWPYTAGKLNQARGERVYNWRERKMIQEPMGSGVWGEVKLTLRTAAR